MVSRGSRGPRSPVPRHKLDGRPAPAASVQRSKLYIRYVPGAHGRLPRSTEPRAERLVEGPGSRVAALPVRLTLSSSQARVRAAHNLACEGDGRGLRAWLLKSRDQANGVCITLLSARYGWTVPFRGLLIWSVGVGAGVGVGIGVVGRRRGRL